MTEWLTFPSSTWLKAIGATLESLKFYREVERGLRKFVRIFDPGQVVGNTALLGSNPSSGVLFMVSKTFFAEPVEEVAKNLLGCRIKRNSMAGRIVETEAYLEDDPASHAHPRKTDRNRLMYDTHGKVYIYLCYGIHYMLNFTADENGVGGVLVRAVEPLEGIEQMKENRGIEEKEELCNGPGKVCEALGITREMNGTEVGEELELERGEAREIKVSKRIGINKAVDKELRFFEKGNNYVSTDL